MTAATRKARFKKEESLAALLLLAPSLLLLTTSVVVPLVTSMRNSFFDSNAYMDAVYKGFGNYLTVLRDSAFWKSIWVGAKFILTIVPVQIVLAFFIAHLIVRVKRPVSSVAKTAIYMPCLLSGIIVGAIFSYIYAYDGGLLNWILGWFGIEPIAWTGDPKFALFSVALAAIWSGLGYVTLVMLGGILDIPRDYYEAAKLDGAGFFQQMFRITIPCIKNLGVYLIISSFVSTFQLFELPFILTGGGPFDLTQGPVGFLYYHFTWDKTLGYTYSASVLIAIVLTAISAIIFKLISSEKSMD